jgi:DNA polymerase
MPKYGFSMFNPSKLRCSAAKAAAYGLPRDLDGACRVAGVVQQKDTDGYRLMLSLCKPRKALKAEKLTDPDWENKLYWRGTPEEFARLGYYCMQDVRAEEALSNAIPDLTPSEQRLWQLDLEVNDRGVRVDAPACEAIIDSIAAHTDTLKKEFQTTLLKEQKEFYMQALSRTLTSRLK